MSSSTWECALAPVCRGSVMGQGAGGGGVNGDGGGGRPLPLASLHPARRHPLATCSSPAPPPPTTGRATSAATSAAPGRAWFTFPVFQSTVWLLALVALVACLVGRLHVYVGALLTNHFFRQPGGAKPPISRGSMFVMWFSGLRGGVAFALAAVSYGNADFPQRCGGIADFPERYCGGSDMSDSLAILQATCAAHSPRTAPALTPNQGPAARPGGHDSPDGVPACWPACGPRARAPRMLSHTLSLYARLLVTAFTIFVLGGLSTEVAVRCGVTVPRHQPQPDGTEMQPRPAAATASIFADAAATAESWLGLGAWGFGPVGASTGPSSSGSDVHCAEDDDDGSDDGPPPRHGGTATSKAPLHTDDQARTPVGAAQRPCTVPRCLAAAVLVLGVVALWTSGRGAVCGAPELSLLSHAAPELSRPIDHLARAQRENGPVPPDSHQAPREHHHEKKPSGAENASR